MRTIGYARVSTRGQDLTLQHQALTAAGCKVIFAEKMSGKDDKRPKQRKMMAGLEPGDLVIVTRLDRLARSTRDLLNLIHDMTEAGAQFRSIADSWCDTTTPHGRLLLTILGGLAEFERSLILARTQAGIARARELGRLPGRKERLNPRQKILVAERYAAGETIAELSREFGVGVATIHRSLKNGAHAGA